MEDNSVFIFNFLSLLVNDFGNDFGDDLVKDLEVFDCDLRRVRVGEGDDFRLFFLVFFCCFVFFELLAGNDFLRFFEFRLIISLRLFLDECLFLEEV